MAGRIGAARGANDLWLASEKVRDNGDLRIFVGLASTLDDHPEDAEHIEADIVAAARELLDRPAPRRWIKVMAARGRSPLTQTIGHDNVEVDPQALRLSDSLRSDLAQWKADFEATLSGWPASGGFDSEHDAERFVAVGRRLVLRLQDELGASYHVEYMPEAIRPPGVRLRANQTANRALIGFLFHCGRTEARPGFCLGVRAVALSSAARTGCVALIWPARSRASPMGGERLKRGLPSSKKRCPPSSTRCRIEQVEDL
ncbi:hypothetical protein GCM10023170_017470 [Phytohabitans houttuyneae]|uniref:Uncharacterized protein n=1 Tax=Phytohabitans houttuyneae TaxID=1076126 RepID=A0A6V8KT40_9ACTN|nr:hypothetical protein Phou_099980 [Phytohabitans houttuyneae]